MNAVQQVQNNNPHHHQMMMMMGIGGQPAVPAPPRMGMGGYMVGPMGHMLGHPHMNPAPPAGPVMQGRQQIQRAAPMRIEQQQQFIQGIRMGGAPHMQQQPVANVRYGYGGGGGRPETVNCPECRSPTTIPPNGLPVNYKVQDLIERVKARSAVIEPVGCICQSCDTPINCSFYFSCTNEECKDIAAVICSMCGLRNHNGHKVTENVVLSSEKVAEERHKIKMMMEDADALKSQFFEQREKIMEQTEHVQDVFSHVLKDFEILDLELDRPEAFTQRDVDLRVHKARQLGKALEMLVSRMEVTKNEVIDTVAKEMDDLLARIDAIAKLDRVVDDPPSAQEQARAEEDEGQEGATLASVLLNDSTRLAGSDRTARLNAYKVQKSMSLQRRREENKKLKSMKKEKRDEMEERRVNLPQVMRVNPGDIKEEPLDQYEASIYDNLNQITLRDDNGETRGAPTGYNHMILKRRRLSPSAGPSTSSGRGRGRERREGEAGPSRPMNAINVHSAIRGPLPFPPQPHLAQPVAVNTPGAEQREMGALVMDRAVDGLINNEDVLDILDDGRIIRQEDIEGIADDGRYMVRPGVIHVMPEGDDDDEIEY